jgi:hypothetical protein
VDFIYRDGKKITGLIQAAKEIGKDRTPGIQIFYHPVCLRFLYISSVAGEGEMPIAEDNTLQQR